MLTELCAEAELVIVMTETALRLLVASGACPEEKVRVVPHGAPARLTARAAERRATRWSSSRACPTATRFLLSTFGLISPGKGLETVIEALPADPRAAPRDRLRHRRAAPIRTSLVGRASDTA